MRIRTRNLAAAFAIVLFPAVLHAQAVVPHPPDVKTGGSKNMKVVSHIAQGGFGSLADIEIEQELNRPYVYTPGLVQYMFQILDIRDVANPKPIYKFQIENPELHRGMGAMDGKYFKTKGRYYYVQSFQFTQAGPNSDVGAIVFDVTGLPDASKVREVARIRAPQTPGGFHNIFAYKHSDGRALLVATTNASHGDIYDLDRVVSGADAATWKIAQVPIPEHSQPATGGYHDFYVGFDVETGQDKLYGAGAGGYFVFDITQAEQPKLLYSMTGIPGVTWGHTFTPTPDHKFAVTEAEYQYAPLRLFDLRPVLEGKTQNITRPISAWTADWQALSHNHEIRWPYVFVSGYEDGLQVFNMINPKKPKTVAWYYTCECEHMNGYGGAEEAKQNIRGPSVANGAFGIDVRNADGLIVISDVETGIWLFRMDGFQGWKGSDWNMPDISSVQDWDNGPPRSGVKPVT